MKLKSLQIQCYRGIHEMQLDFHPQMNVLVGVNGAGKSTVLDALSIMLSRVVSLIRSGKNAGKDIAPFDISAGKTDVRLGAILEDDGVHFGWGLAKSLKGRRKASRSDLLPEGVENVKVLTERIRQKIDEAQENCSIPVLIYYQANRIALNFPRFVHTDRDFSLLSVYHDALSCRADYRVLLEWFRERENAEDREFKRLVMEARSESGTNSDAVQFVAEFHDPQLQAVRNAWKLFMPEISEFTIMSNPLRLEAKKNGVSFRIDQLSDGEKSLLALSGDIARRLAIANPTRSNPLEGEAIILVDEIDLHFHPKRQRTILQQLMEVFPHCQFIVATHSPQILGRVHAESIFLLVENDEGVIVLERPEESFGMTTNEILEDIMEVPSRDPDEEEKLLRLFELIERRKLVEAKALVEEIRNYRRSEPKLLAADARIQCLENFMKEE
ncbi:MAG: AAA family ATPase [Planctomycetia bacterium]|nr:AAA family ATPase [Planctomycetia bacterium]